MSLGSIVVRLTMNTADFETDAGRASKVAQKRAKEIDQAFKKAGVAIGLALGAAVLGATTAIKGAVDRMDDLSKASQKVGMPTEDFSRLAYAGELADVSMETLVGSLGKLTKAQAAALKETSEQAKVFDALGIAATNADGSLRPAADVLGEFADRFKAMEGSPEAMAAGFSLFGRSFQEMIPLLKDGSAGLREAAAESDALRKTLSTEAGQAAEEFNDNLTRLQGAMGGVWMEIADELLPRLIDLTEEMLGWVKEGDNATKTAEAFATGLEGIGTFAAATTNLIGGLAKIVGGFVEQAWGFYKVLAGILSLDLSTIQSGWGNMKSGGAGMSGGFGQIVDPRDQGMFAGKKYAQYSGPLLAPSQALEEAQIAEKAKAIKDARRQAEALRKALGDPDPKAPRSGKAKAAELTEEQKAAKALNEEYARTAESLRERLGLMGLETEAARMKWETEEGSFNALDPMRKAELVATAALVDAKQKALDTEEEAKRLVESLLEPHERVNQERAEAAALLAAGAIAQDDYNRAIAANRTPAEQMLADLQFEMELLGKTREQQELLTAARYLGAEAATAQGKAALAAMADQQQATKAMDEQIAAMDAFRDAATDALVDFASGAKTGKEAMEDFFRSMSQMILRMIAEKWIEQLFGAKGSDGSGTSGGGWLSSLVGGFLSSFGGAGKAGGGYTGAGGVNQYAGPVHKGEVVWSQGDIARSGGVAAVESMRRGSGARASGEAKRPLVVFNEAQMLDALAANGGLEKVVVHYMERNRDRLRANA